MNHTLEAARAELGLIEAEGNLYERFYVIFTKLEEFRGLRGSEVREWTSGGGASNSGLFNMNPAQKMAHMSGEFEKAILSVAHGKAMNEWEWFGSMGLDINAVFELSGYSLNKADMARLRQGSQERSIVRVKAMLLSLSKAAQKPASALSEVLLSFEVRLGLAQEVIVDSHLVAHRVVTN